MMKRALLLTLFLLGPGFAQAQTYYSRAELKKPLSETVEKTLSEFIDKCMPEKEKQLAAHMEDVIKTIDEAVKLNADEKTALQNEAKKAVETAVKAWKPLGTVAMRTYLSRTSETAAVRHINSWKPDVAGPNEPVEGWTPPQEDASWLATLRKTLGEERFKTWSDADAKEKAKIDKDIASHLTRWGGESRGPMNEDLKAKIGLMKTSLSLNEERVKALNTAADALLNRLVDAERKRATDMLRTMIPAAREHIMGRSYFYVRFDRPRGEAWDKMWQDAANKVLPADMIAGWTKAEKEERNKADAELADMIKPSEQQAQQQMEVALSSEIDSIATALDLNQERRQALEKLSKEAIQESLKQARKGWLQQAKNYSTAERKRIRGNVYFGVNEEQMAGSLPVWKDGLKKILSEEERTRMAAENKQREDRTSRAMARACLAEMDKTLVLNQEQRAQLEPLLVEQMQPLLEQRRQQYWSYNATQLFQCAGKAKEDKVRPVLDDMQWAHWKELIKGTSSSSRNTVPGTVSSAEVTDMEAAISAHLYKMFVAERKKVLDTMLPQVEDAHRVLKLPKETVAHLTTAAKGAVEESLAYWRQNTERYVRQSVQTATVKNILQALAGTERVSFSRNDSGPQNSELWLTALKTSLNAEQQKQLQQVVDARRDYRLKAMAAMSTSELDRRRRLTTDQCVKVEAAIQKVLAEYLPDIERYMSFQWFLQYYYALVPLGGVAEKDLQAILTPEQWKLCKERDLPDAMQYWEGIKNNHDNRVKQGVKVNNAIFFNGGIILDE
jgi:hypothetical protein